MYSYVSFVSAAALSLVACASSAPGEGTTPSNAPQEPASHGEAGVEESYPENYPPGWLRKQKLETPSAQYWDETDGVSPGVDGWHHGFTDKECASPTPLPPKEIGELCLTPTELLETNPTPKCHEHKLEHEVYTGHPDVFNCNSFCTGIGYESGACDTTPAAGGHVASAHCTCVRQRPCGNPGQPCCTVPTDLDNPQCKVGRCDKSHPQTGWNCVAAGAP